MRLRFSARGRDGVAVVVLHDNRVLALKRIFIPLLMEFPGEWSLLLGAREPNEHHELTVFRELFEETGIRRSDVSKMKHLGAVTLHSKGIFGERQWKNELFIVNSRVSRIMLNFENSAFDWLAPEELAQRGVLNAFDSNARALLLREIR